MPTRPEHTSSSSRTVWPRWLLLAGCALTLLGYFAPWVDHPAAGLAILGIDMGEYVKFLVPVRDGTLAIWREGFYLPLLTVSLTLSLYAFRSETHYPLWLRILMLAAAGVSALNMLPPAWTPALLRTAEFRTQSLWIAVALAALLVSPFLALLPRWLAAALAATGAVASIVASLWMFLAVLTPIEALYNHPLAPAWGIWTTVAGLLVVAIAAILLALPVTNLTKIHPNPALS